MTYLLDTNVVSELRRGRKADQRVRDWAESQELESQFLSVVTIQELEYGMLLKRRRDEVEGLKLARWLHYRLMPDLEGRILPLDSAIALATAALHVPVRRPERDAWIAATALVHRLTVVTRNTRDFQETGVPLLNPWET